MRRPQGHSTSTKRCRAPWHSHRVCWSRLAWQLEEIGIAQTKSKIKMEYGEIYGAEHLTRLLTKLPEIVNAHAVEAYTEAYHSGGEPPPPTDWKELVRTPPLNPF